MVNNINNVMQSYTNTYNEAQENYLTLLNDVSSQWKQNIRISIEDFDNVTTALNEFVASAELMKNKAHEYMNSDITLLTETQAHVARAADTSVLDYGSIIEATGQAFDKYYNSRAMMLYYTRSLAESREYYNAALDCYNNALSDQVWWNNLMPILIEENKNRGSRWMSYLHKTKRPGAAFDAISAFGDARGRINKYSLRKRKPKKRKSKNKTAKNKTAKN